MKIQYREILQASIVHGFQFRIEILHSEGEEIFDSSRTYPENHSTFRGQRDLQFQFVQASMNTDRCKKLSIYPETFE